MVHKISKIHMLGDSGSITKAHNFFNMVVQWPGLKYRSHSTGQECRSLLH